MWNFQKRRGLIIKGYDNDPIWRDMQRFLPEQNRLSDYNLPHEYTINIHGMNIHVDHYRHEKPKAKVILFHGVGGNGRLLSFIALPLHKNGFEVICPDLPLYGYTEYSDKINYDTWVKCGTEIVQYYQNQDSLKTFLFGLSAGGMLAYQVACACGVNGVIATCILDQREAVVTRKTARNPIFGALGKRFMWLLRYCFPDLRLPMKLVSNMKCIVNNQALAKILMADARSAGVRVPIRFLHTMLSPQFKTEPERFDRCPFLLVHPEQDMWTDLSLSLIFYDRLACEKELKLLKGAGHFPIEPEGLGELEIFCLEFMERNRNEPPDKSRRP